MTPREVQVAVSIILPDMPREQIALVLFALDRLHLLGDFEGPAEAYVQRVQDASREALRRVTRERTLRLVEPPDDAA